MAVNIEVDSLVAREVINLSYALEQKSDVEGRPSAVTRGGQIHVTVKSLNDGNTDFFEWVCDPYVTKGGVIKFEKRDGTPMKELKFEDAYLVEYKEIFDSIDAGSQLEKFTISAKKIDIGGIFHVNNWADL